jgi:hypothetical protein
MPYGKILGLSRESNGTICLNMLALTPPEVPVVIRARLDHLRKRKDFLDSMIEATERYVQFASAEAAPGFSGAIRKRPSRCRRAANEKAA